AWQRQDFAAMYRELSTAAAHRYSQAQFTNYYVKAQRTATVKQVMTGGPDETNVAGQAAASVPVSFETNAFGRISAHLVLPLDGSRVVWSPSDAFPGLQPGERLVRRTRAPERAAILARGGTPLAEGPATARSSPLGAPAANVAGEVSTPSPRQDRELVQLGFPPGEPTGTSGLELAF